MQRFLTFSHLGIKNADTNSDFFEVSGLFKMDAIREHALLCIGEEFSKEG